MPSPRRNLPPNPVSPSPPCRGRACPARNLPPYPFCGQSVGEGFIPPGHFPPPQTATAARGLAALHITREGLLTCGASRTPPPTIVAINPPPACRGRACPARSLTAYPLCGSSVGRGRRTPTHPATSARVGSRCCRRGRRQGRSGCRHLPGNRPLDITIRYKHPTIAGQGNGATVIFGMGRFSFPVCSQCTMQLCPRCYTEEDLQNIFYASGCQAVRETNTLDFTHKSLYSY